MKRFFLALFAMFAFGTTMTPAQMVESTPAPRPAKPDFSSMAFYLGSWSCWKKSSRRPAAFKETATWSLDPSGYWLVGKWWAPGSPWFPYADAYEQRVTYDADSGRWALVMTGSLGDYDVMVSDGWKSGKLAWHSLAFAKGKDIATITDFTITKISATQTSSFDGFTTVAGKSVSVTGGCTKAL